MEALAQPGFAPSGIPGGLGAVLELRPPGKGDRPRFETVLPATGRQWSGSNREQRKTETKTGLPPDTNRLEAELINARMMAMTIMSRFSMHLSAHWRAKIFSRLDELLDPKEWGDDDGFLDALSLRTFLRFLLHSKAKTLPSLGLSNKGNIIAAWRSDSRRATIEFLRNDRCLIVLSVIEGDDPTILSFSGLVSEAPSLVAREHFSLG